MADGERKERKIRFLCKTIKSIDIILPSGWDQWKYFIACSFGFFTGVGTKISFYFFFLLSLQIVFSDHPCHLFLFLLRDILTCKTIKAKKKQKAKEMYEKRKTNKSDIIDNGDPRHFNWKVVTEIGFINIPNFRCLLIFHFKIAFIL